MAYFTPKDFAAQIQSDNLNQISGYDATILSRAQLTAIEEAKSYLVQKYDLAWELQDTPLWDNTKSYLATNRVYLNPPAYSATSTYAIGAYVTQASQVYKCNTTISVVEAFTVAHWTLVGPQYAVYSAILPYPQFDFNTLYTTGTKVWWKNNIYTCAIATQTYSQSQSLQFVNYQNIPALNPAPDDVNNGLIFWGAPTPYTVPVNTDILNTTYWAATDNRSQQLLTYMIDITLYHLHARIAPRNIPDLRVKRYDDAIKWLKAAGKGEITANIARLQPWKGKRIRYGGVVKNQNSY